MADKHGSGRTEWLGTGVGRVGREKICRREGCIKVGRVWEKRSGMEEMESGARRMGQRGALTWRAFIRCGIAKVCGINGTEVVGDLGKFNKRFVRTCGWELGT
jgi:hypothetical protein